MLQYIIAIPMVFFAFTVVLTPVVAIIKNQMVYHDGKFGFGSIFGLVSILMFLILTICLPYVAIASAPFCVFSWVGIAAVSAVTLFQ